ncbi:SDR family NAD(P)-dependent oxidoreductase [Rhizomicrobium electricum]|uniref:SDR family NAD(P)-dependent oxidoreductase n=1 Tax=Rhizomicrobium electricum TaxID=480070 RepID=A0ABN1EGA4_9PROT|nr:SDR family NAD(P)-dependent oxidoreductase [Rhizomicrobium electricum]
MGNILISGASSGIGAALAHAYAAPGVDLTLWGRDRARLQSVAETCRARGAHVATSSFDLTDLEALHAALDAAVCPDIAIFNAGLGGSVPHDAVAQDSRAAGRMAMVNFVAPVIGANAVADKMGRRGAGHIVLVGSIAALFPLPMAPTYSGSKAGIKMFAEALDARMRRHGVFVTLVSPGFIDTPMSQSVTEPKPFLMTPEKAAAVIKRKVARGARQVVVPWQYAAIGALSRVVPKFLVRAILSKF